MKLPLVLIGAGGHAKVALSLARAAGWTVLGVCDPDLARQDLREWRGLRVLGGDEALADVDPTQVGLLNGIGQTVGGGPRQRLFDELTQRGFRFLALVHPAATVDPSVALDDGVQVMAGAIVQADSRIGCNTIVNTGASVDHDCTVGPHVHIAPGATLCGSVRVDDGAFVGAGATVVQGLHIGSRAFVQAGAVLVRDLAERRRWPSAEPAKFADDSQR